MKSIATIAAAGLVLGASYTAKADCSAVPANLQCETGTVILDSSGQHCLKFHLSESGNPYAIIYSITPPDPNPGHLKLLDNGAVRSIVSNGTTTSGLDCGRPSLVVTGVRVN